MRQMLTNDSKHSRHNRLAPLALIIQAYSILTITALTLVEYYIRYKLWNTSLIGRNYMSANAIKHYSSGSSSRLVQIPPYLYFL